MAGRHAGSAHVLSKRRARHCAGYYFLLGGAHDLFGHRTLRDIPFPHVFIHGLVRDELGRKMSKSLGNGVDPLEIIEKYGADALRFALLTGSSAGNDTRWQEEKIQSSRNFANKINNAARFILMNLEDYDTVFRANEADLINLDKWILTRCAERRGVPATLKSLRWIALEKTL